MEKRFIRTELLLGKEALNRLAASSVAIAGLGGVGAYAAEALVRSGVGYVRLIDFDCIKYSNFNRQLLALEDSLGKRKVDVAAERLRQINPDCIIDKKPHFIDQSNAAELINGVDRNDTMTAFRRFSSCAGGKGWENGSKLYGSCS